jgi:hypothetical protein
VVFGAMVEGFSLSPTMQAYLRQLPPLTMDVRCFVTQHFPKPWMGGNRAVRQFKKLCREKGAEVTQTGVVNWTSPEREAQIADVVARLSRI